LEVFWPENGGGQVCILVKLTTLWEGCICSNSDCGQGNQFLYGIWIGKEEYKTLINYEVVRVLWLIGYGGPLSGRKQG